MNSLDATEKVLQEEGKPLAISEITALILARDLWHTTGKTPADTIEARLAVDIRARGSASRFQRTAARVFALRSWGLPEHASKPFRKKTSPQPVEKSKMQPGTSKRNQLTPPPTSSISFAAAAETILGQNNKQPMHYREITRRVVESGLVVTRGRTPDRTMYTQILSEIEQAQRRGETPHFTTLGRGMIGLTHWSDAGLADQIEQHNNDVKRALSASLYRISPGDFENLIGSLLVKIGFVNVEVVGKTNDGGIDVRGTLVVADVIKTHMAVQAKRWKNNVQAPVVRDVRGGLGVHDKALIITTSDFSMGARLEAERPNAVPVALMNGEQLVALLVEYKLGVTRSSYDLIELDTSES
jgi:restriction system protein